MRIVSFAAAAVLAVGLIAAPDALAQRGKKKAAAPPPDPAIVAVQQLDAETAAKLDAAIAGAHRSADNRARDAFRKPKETLAFFGLKSNMRVLEVNPGGGWYTEILAPTLKDSGQLFITGGDVNNARGRQGLSTFLGRLAKDGPVYEKVQFTGPWQAQAAQPAPGSLDMVVTFRNVHNFVWQKTAEQQLKDWFTMLKPGGVLGVEEHRWPEDRPNDQKIDGVPGNGYMKTSEVVALVEAAGFKLVGSSEINANPKDTRVHPFGVWTLPPNLRSSPFGQPENPAFDKKPYQAIGESDRMTLKFVKP
jgi:predicted methyltransferase